MRNRIATLGLFVVLLLGVQSAFADSVNYFTTNTYGSGTPTTPLTAPGSTFSFSFSVPLPVTLSASDSDSFTTIVPVVYSLGASTVTVPGTAVIFFAASLSGGFDINFTLNGNSYLWEFFGASTPLATVPEPSSLTLLVTGIVGIAGAIRRKFLSGIRA